MLKRNNGLIDAIEQGRTKRQEVESAIIQNAQVISDNVKLRDVKIIEGITQNAKALDQSLN